MELAFSIVSLIFSFLAFVTAVGTLTYLLARRFSTHEVRYDNSQAETTFQYDAPQSEAGEESRRPTPVNVSQAEHDRMLHMAELEAQFEQRVSDIDF